jgi:dehydrogenase/reductase SDR family protein 7
VVILLFNFVIDTLLQPVLLMLYLMQYFPELGFAVMDRVGPKRVKAYKEGASGYSSNLFFKKDT